MAAARKPMFSVSGGSIDRSYPDGGVALSAAITFASRNGDETTMYVRNPDGSPYGRVERREGTILIYSEGGRS